MWVGNASMVHTHLEKGGYFSGNCGEWMNPDGSLDAPPHPVDAGLSKIIKWSSFSCITISK